MNANSNFQQYGRENSNDENSNSELDPSILHLKKPLNVCNVDSTEWDDYSYTSSRMDPIDWSTYRLPDSKTSHNINNSKNNYSSNKENIPQTLKSLIKSQSTKDIEFSNYIKNSIKPNTVLTRASNIKEVRGEADLISINQEIRNECKGKIKVHNSLKSAFRNSNNSKIPLSTIEFTLNTLFEKILKPKKNHRDSRFHSSTSCMDKGDIAFEPPENRKYSQYKKCKKSLVQATNYNIHIENQSFENGEDTISSQGKYCQQCSADILKAKPDKKSLGIQHLPETKSIGTQYSTFDFEENQNQMANINIFNQFSVKEILKEPLKTSYSESNSKNNSILSSSSEIVNEKVCSDNATIKDQKHDSTELIDEEKTTAKGTSVPKYGVPSSSQELDKSDFIDPYDDFDIVGIEDHECYAALRQQLMKLTAAQILPDRESMIEKASTISEDEEYQVMSKEDEAISNDQEHLIVKRDEKMPAPEEEIMVTKNDNDLNESIDSTASFVTAIDEMISLDCDKSSSNTSISYTPVMNVTRKLLDRKCHILKDKNIKNSDRSKLNFVQGEKKEEKDGNISDSSASSYASCSRFRILSNLLKKEFSSSESDGNYY